MNAHSFLVVIPTCFSGTFSKIRSLCTSLGASNRMGKVGSLRLFQSENLERKSTVPQMVQIFMISLMLLKYFIAGKIAILDGPLLVCECKEAFFIARLVYSKRRKDYRLSTDTIPFPAGLPPKRRLLSFELLTENKPHALFLGEVRCSSSPSFH